MYWSTLQMAIRVSVREARSPDLYAGLLVCDNTKGREPSSAALLGTLIRSWFIRETTRLEEILMCGGGIVGGSWSTVPQHQPTIFTFSVL